MRIRINRTNNFWSSLFSSHKFSDIFIFEPFTVNRSTVANAEWRQRKPKAIECALYIIFIYIICIIIIYIAQICIAQFVWWCLWKQHSFSSLSLSFELHLQRNFLMKEWFSECVWLKTFHRNDSVLEIVVPILNRNWMKSSLCARNEKVENCNFHSIIWIWNGHFNCSRSHTKCYTYASNNNYGFLWNKNVYIKYAICMLHIGHVLELEMLNSWHRGLSCSMSCI